MEKRFDYIDIAKGIAIFLVVYIHIFGMSDKFPNWIAIIIASLDNPTFYFASGILFKRSFESKDGKSILIERGMNLLIPFFIWCCVYSAYVYTIVKVTISDYKFSYMNVANKLWFLPVLFLTFCVSTFIIKTKLDFKKTIMIFLLVITLSSFLSSLIAKIISYSLIVYIGTIYYDLTKNGKKKLGAICFIMCLLLWILCVLSNWIKIQDTCTSGIKLLIFLINSIFGGIGLVSVIDYACDWLPKTIKGVIASLGRRSLYVYILHFIFVYWMEVTRESNADIFILLLSIVTPILLAQCISQNIMNVLLFKPSCLFTIHKNGDQL
ncbi:MAG: acyltransferase family protein [Lachnospiraceae bacterium]|jgi:fucose 4-O-acetylase-like acetyltransferase